MNDTLDQPTTSIPAVMALVLIVLSLPGFVCCMPFGCGTAFIAIPLAGVGIFQFHTGKANTASGVIAWLAMVMSLATVVGWSVLVGVAGLGHALEEQGIEVPSSLTQESAPESPPTPAVPAPAPASP